MIDQPTEQYPYCAPRTMLQRAVDLIGTTIMLAIIIPIGIWSMMLAGSIVVYLVNRNEICLSIIDFLLQQ